jgi:hypothetical protein
MHDGNWLMAGEEVGSCPNKMLALYFKYLVWQHWPSAAIMEGETRIPTEVAILSNFVFITLSLLL